MVARGSRGCRTDRKPALQPGRVGPAVVLVERFFLAALASAVIARYVASVATIATVGLPFIGHVTVEELSTQLAILDERPNHGVRYPSLIQTGSEDDPQLWIFYTHDPVDSKGSWDTATFMARQIQITAIPK